MKIIPILRWPGGKTRLLNDIMPLMRPHETYVEAFAGGLALLLAKQPSKAEIINDLNGELINLYRYAQYHLDALTEEVRWTLNSRQSLKDMMQQPGITDLQRAARYLLRNRMSFGGAGTSFAVSVQAQPSRANVLEALKHFSDRLDKVAVENLSYEQLFKSYDRPKTLWFLDPPYSAGKVKNYQMWGHEEMRTFADLVSGLEGDWIVTVNDCLENRELFAAHEIIPVLTRSQCGNQRTAPGRSFGELIIRRRAGKPSKAVWRATAAPGARKAA